MEIINMLVGFGQAMLPAMLRSVAGWAENAFQDRRIEKFELVLLGETMIRVGIITAGTFFGLNGMGFEISGMASGFAAIVIDFFLTKKAK